MYEDTAMIEFTALDRCDRCGAQAYTCARSEFGELLFCAHHSRVYRDTLMDEGWEVIDDLEALSRLIDGPVAAY